MTHGAPKSLFIMKTFMSAGTPVSAFHTALAVIKKYFEAQHWSFVGGWSSRARSKARRAITESRVFGVTEEPSDVVTLQPPYVL